MNTYIMTCGFTRQGMQNIKESPARVETAKKIVRELGGEVKTFYVVMGAAYDTVFILEAPSDEVVAGMALAISSQGNVRTDTHRVFTEEEFKKVIASLP